MKIEWLNDDLTECYVTRGWWFWKRAAYVVRHNAYWHFKTTDRRVDYTLDHKLDAAMRNERTRRIDADFGSRWLPVSNCSLPKSRIVNSGKKAKR